MTINSEVRVAGPYTGNGSTTAFPFAFKVFSADEVLVVSETAGVETVLVLGSDYTVALNPDQDASPGGTIALAAPLATGKRLTLTSALEYLQPVDLTNQGGFYPRVINNAFDRLTILQQQLFERLSRALVFPISDGGVGEIPGGGARAGAVLAFDESGDPVVGPSIAAVGTVAGNVGGINTVASNIDDVSTVASNIEDVTNFSDVYYGPSETDPVVRRDGSPLQKGDLYFSTTEDALRTYDGIRWAAAASGSISATTFSGNGTQTAFFLPSSPGAKANTQIYISGVYQQKSEYELAGTTLTFSAAPPSGVNNIEVVTLAPLPVDPLTAEDITDLIALRSEAVRKTAPTGAAIIPAGTEAQRPGVPTNGMLRYDAGGGQFEGYQGGQWSTLGAPEAARIDVASAATVDLTALAPNTRNIRITGTTTITGFTLAVGRLYFVSFSGALTLTNNAAIVTNTGGNIATFAGMTMAIRATAANVVEVLYVPRYASNAEVQAGARADVAVTPASLASLVKDYTSPPTTYANGGQLTFNHGLGFVPSVITWQLTCVIAQGGYSVGDVLFMPVGISGSGGSTGIITRATSTQIIANIGAGGLLTLTLPSGSGGTTLTPANWTITARAKL